MKNQNNLVETMALKTHQKVLKKIQEPVHHHLSFLAIAACAISSFLIITTTIFAQEQNTLQTAEPQSQPESTVVQKPVEENKSTTLNTEEVNKPDLTIVDIYFSPNTPTTGEQFTGEVRVKVKNQGAGATNGAQGVSVIITIADAKSNVSSEWANAGFYYLDNLIAGSSGEAKFPVKYTTFSSEILRIKAWVDSNSLSSDSTDNLFINESDENNNFFKKDITLVEAAGDLLYLELDKIALNSSEIESGFKITHLTYNASDVSASNSGITQPSESITQAYQPENSQTDLQSFSVGLRTHKSITDARKHFDAINTQHARQVIALSASEKEIFGDDIFCHASPDFTTLNHKEGRLDIYYFICGFRYKNIFIDLQATLTTNDYKIALRNLRQYYDNIINYDPGRTVPLPQGISTNSISKPVPQQISKLESTSKTAVESKKATLESDKTEHLIIKLERTISALEQRIVELEKKLVAAIDQGLVSRVKGRILLQVEENGEAWYVDPESENKLYLKDGEAAYDIMRALGLGITNANLEKIPIGLQEKLFNLKDTDSDGVPDKTEVAVGTDPAKSDSDSDGYNDKAEILSGYKPNSTKKYSYDAKLISRLKGRILLQVESHGEAWYINPVDNKRYYLGDPDTAYNVMRFLSLGIKNNDLRKIQVGEFEEKE
ncbi:MAG: hypothetical protein A2927_03385 [Candidatus Komeilibacteria bacterium RIFCSPLOWO2_01_FULL_45_10]|uniref:CARDB domain-containing protein n=1 Tax=Candidatus Komeilibacteria bacterium RIFCSPLOWO2_01_FULL_45_10 TaxID=1798550 RepID=A0A1G2BKL8_9BACT|nr:MAG: hypothetical protein A2927_03385 [Candidatus Komeilibacteria bacterium RIFCSPLOWO2_01_FULL_45_10]